MADVARVVGEAGGPRAFVTHALHAECKRKARTAGQLLAEVEACGGLVPFAAVIVADRLVIEALADTPGVADLSLALDHGRALLVAMDAWELAGAVAGMAVSP